MKNEHFQDIPSNSIVILDDYTFNPKKQSKHEFLHIVNYYLRHNNITLIIVIHNLYSSGLFNEILLAPHLFLAYTNLGYYILKKIQQRIGGNPAVEFWQEPVRFNFDFSYINCQKNYIINYINRLILGDSATMFANQQKYVIHLENHSCQNMLSNTQPNSVKREIDEYLASSYPKNKNLNLVAKILVTNNLLNDDLFFNEFSNVHFADFCAFINNRFDKIGKTNSNLVKFCKYLQKKHIKFPKIVIKNPVAQKIIT